jgi:hypothetical protein
MKFSLALVIAAAAGGSHAKACNPWFGDCVSFYNGINCEGELGNYVPTNGGNCFVFSAFTSIFAVRGSFSNDVNCRMFSDTNCQNEIASVSTEGTGVAGNCGHVPLDFNGLPIQFAQSMICIA